MESLKKYLESGDMGETRMRKNLEVVKQYLNAQEFKYFCDDKEGIIGLGFNDVKMKLSVTDDLVTVHMFFRNHLTKETYVNMLVFLNKVNTILKQGHFEVEDEKVSFRISTRLEDGTVVSPFCVESMMHTCANMGAHFAAMIGKVIEDEMDGEEAFALAVVSIMKDKLGTEDEE